MIYSSVRRKVRPSEDRPGGQWHFVLKCGFKCASVFSASQPCTSRVHGLTLHLFLQATSIKARTQGESRVGSPALHACSHMMQCTYQQFRCLNRWSKMCLSFVVWLIGQASVKFPQHIWYFLPSSRHRWTQQEGRGLPRSLCSCVNIFFIFFYFRSTHPDGAWKTQNSGLHPVPARRWKAGGLLRRPFHRQVGQRVGGSHRVQRHLPWPAGGEARVEEMHRGEAPHVLLC